MTEDTSWLEGEPPITFHLGSENRDTLYGRREHNWRFLFGYYIRIEPRLWCGNRRYRRIGYRAKNPWVSPIVEFAFEVGPKRGNLLRLNWADVALKEGSILLRAVKNSRSPEELIDVPVGLSRARDPDPEEVAAFA